MSEGKSSKFGHSSKAARAPSPSTSATSSRTMASRKSRMLSMPIANRRGEIVERTAVQRTVKKVEIYEALYGLNTGIQQFLNSLDSLDAAGLGLPFLNGYRILADEIRSAINFSTAEAMTAIELCDYEKFESQRSQFTFPPTENLTAKPKNANGKR